MVNEKVYSWILVLWNCYEDIIFLNVLFNVWIDIFYILERRDVFCIFLFNVICYMEIKICIIFYLEVFVICFLVSWVKGKWFWSIRS